jgi:hypothetical protein
MKKVLTTLFFLHLLALVTNAQIYTSVAYYDKFDDVIKKEQRKTLIEKTDSTIIIEEKGKKPVVYYIVNEVEELMNGSKNNIVNLIDNVYGYQEGWCLVRYDLIDQYFDTYSKVYVECIKDRLEDVLKDDSIDDSKDDSKIKEKLSILRHYWIFATHRTITTQYTGSFIADVFWLEDEENEDRLGKGVNRIIYRRD